MNIPDPLPSSLNVALGQLARSMGKDGARQLIETCCAQKGIDSLDSPEGQLQLAEALVELSGLAELAGRVIRSRLLLAKSKSNAAIAS